MCTLLYGCLKRLSLHVKMVEVLEGSTVSVIWGVKRDPTMLYGMCAQPCKFYYCN